jgi:DNA replication protein DnaC
MGANRGPFVKNVVLTDRIKERMCIPRRFWNVTFKRISDGDHKEAFREFLKNVDDVLREGLGMILWGDNDCGKTSMACLALMVARRHGFTGMFITANQYLNDVMSKAVFDDATTVAQRCKMVDLLVIDDLGKDAHNEERLSVAIERMFEDLLRSRSNDVKSTIITTNLDSDDRDKRFGKSIINLIGESNAAIKVIGPSQREIEQERVARFFKPRG